MSDWYNESDWRGLTTFEAFDKAEKMHLRSRVIIRDGEIFGSWDPIHDFHYNRINLELNNGIVIKAYQG